MILFDLNLPKVGGMEVLQQIKKEEALKSIPVIVLTASPREEDVVRTYNLGVNTYIQKPVEFDNFMRVVHAVQEYWIVIASLPPPGSALKQRERRQQGSDCKHVLINFPVIQDAFS